VRPSDASPALRRRIPPGKSPNDARGAVRQFLGGVLGNGYTAAVTIAFPVLLTIIGVSIILGRKSPVVFVAIIFLLIGLWAGQTWVGGLVVAQLGQLARAAG
jgi:hypothetical protein